MARAFFNTSEEKLLQQLQVLKDLIGNQKLHETPCPLLSSQLNELGVLSKLLQTTVEELKTCVIKAEMDS